jgi:hypothetical protein
LNEKHLERFPGDTDLSARIASYELAAKMQLSVPVVCDLSRETAATRARYGADDPNPVRAGFARNCILARRFLEQGVRFVQLFNGAYAMGEGAGNWDGHKKLKEQYDVHGPILDKPAAALLEDLKARACSKTPSCSGRRSSEGCLRSRKGRADAITTLMASRCGSPVPESAAERATDRRTSSGTGLWRTWRRSMNCTRRSSTFSASTTSD